ncbi:MAG: S-adenosyl-L-methionine-dependent methyltransferase [Monoraphidium minutum]|nr:MAG: S-adenosyl-L-methionine-dependent methyltransferase [Monoraphidium minutum]
MLLAAAHIGRRVAARCSAAAPGAWARAHSADGAAPLAPLLQARHQSGAAGGGDGAGSGSGGAVLGGELIGGGGGSGVEASTSGREQETPLLHSIRNRIMIRGGPLSVADYMQEVLTNPLAGFYMTRDVFGRRGDFVTSPEISQMFGEMVGVWCLVAWMNLGRPPRLRLVELGPGRGTLMADLLRAAGSYPEFAAALEVELVELSPALRRVQWTALKCASAGGDGGPKGPDAGAAGGEAAGGGGEAPPLEGVAGVGGGGARVRWRAALDEVPAEGPPAVYLAHEFFDALPVHQGWLEKMVDTAELSDPGPHHLRFVLSPHPTPAAALLVPRRLAALPQEQRDALDAIEISAHGMATAERLAQRVGGHGGAALVIDYGRGAPPYGDSLVAIRGHEGVPALSRPGSADLSAWVDFGALRAAAEGSGAAVEVHGPVSQAHLLLSLGIQARAQALAGAAATEGAAAAVGTAYHRLVGGSGGGGMGESYRALAIVGAGAPVPVGFEGGGAERGGVEGGGGGGGGGGAGGVKEAV